MNKDQRKYLVDAITAQYRDEQRALNDRKPKEPSLNNYLTAAVLNGSFVLRSSESLRTAITQRVRDLGRDEALVERGRAFSRHEETLDRVMLPALLLFEEPPEYTAARSQYESELATWQAEVDALEAAFKAMTLKVQVGSAEALQGIVAQADRLCSLSLSATNARLQLGSGS